MLDAITEFDELDVIEELENAVKVNDLNAASSALSKISQDESLGKNLNYLFMDACENNDADIAALLIKDKRVIPDPNGIIHAVLNDKLRILKLLLQDGRIDPAIQDHFATLMAIEQKSLEAVKLLLSDRRVAPSFNDYQFIEAAIKANSFEIFEFLLPLSFLNIFSRPNCENLLKEAIFMQNLEIIKKLISHELFDREILPEYLLLTKNAKIVECLLQNSEIFNVSLLEIINPTPETLLLETSKYFGNQFSYLNKNKEKFSHLQFEAIKSIYRVDKEIYIGQKYIKDILKQYLNYTGRTAIEVLHPNGNCRGFGFINQTYDENEFYTILYYLNEFKGSMEKIHSAILTELTEEYTSLVNPHASLEEYIAKFLPGKFEVEIKKSPVPESLKKFKNAYELLETFISQVVFAQGFKLEKELHERVITKKCLPTGEFLNVANRSAQYEYIKDYSSNKQFKRVFSYSDFQLKKDELQQIITFLSFWPNIKVNISIVYPLGTHLVSLSITSDGKLKYYDPNFPKKIEMNTISELITYITRDTFSFLGRKCDDNRSDYFSFEAHKFYENVNVTAYETPKIGNEFLNGYPNPCGFNDLHFAIMRNDKSMVIDLLKSEPKIDINSKEVFGNTPLMWAVRMNNVEIFQELIINGANVHEKNNQGIDAMFLLIREGSFDCIKLLLDENKKMGEIAKGSKPS